MRKFLTFYFCLWRSVWKLCNIISVQNLFLKFHIFPFIYIKHKIGRQASVLFNQTCLKEKCCVCVFIYIYNFIRILSSFLISVLVSSWNWWMNWPKVSCAQPLMMAYERSESTWDNFDKFIYQFQPETKTLIRKLERILTKLYRHNVSLLFINFENFYKCI